MIWTTWGRGGTRTTATLAVLAIVAAAFLAGVLVGSAQAAARLTASPGALPDRPSASPPIPHDAAAAREPSPPASDVFVTPPQPESLPACTYADAHATLDPWRHWDAIVLDTAWALRARDVPPDLVDTAEAGLNGGHLIRAIVIDDLRALARAARRAGAALAIQSAYRSHAEQVQTFGHWVAAAGRRKAIAHSARPGHSEHQLGTTIDFTTAGAGAPWAGSDWAGSDAGTWLIDHAGRYGFVLSYPRGARGVTCYAYEPWHHRYVGRPIAGAIAESGMHGSGCSATPPAESRREPLRP